MMIKAKDWKKLSDFQKFVVLVEASQYYTKGSQVLGK